MFTIDIYRSHIAARIREFADPVKNIKDERAKPAVEKMSSNILIG